MSMITRVLALTTLLARTNHQVQAFTPTLRQAIRKSSVIQGSFNHQFSRKPSSTVVRMSSASSEVKKRVLVPIAEDSEEIETASITDVLTRFGAEVVVASVESDGKLVVKMSRGLKICADITIEDAAKEEFDCIALPGGMPGANYLRDSAPLIEMLKKQQDKKKLYGAMCASPAVVLQTHGLLVGSGATCYPAPPFRKTMEDPSDDKVVVQDNVVTSQGPGTSLLFALSLGEHMVSHFWYLVLYCS